MAVGLMADPSSAPRIMLKISENLKRRPRNRVQIMTLSVLVNQGINPKNIARIIYFNEKDFIESMIDRSVVKIEKRIFPRIPRGIIHKIFRKMVWKLIDFFEVSIRESNKLLFIKNLNLEFHGNF